MNYRRLMQSSPRGSGPRHAAQNIPRLGMTVRGLGTRPDEGIRLDGSGAAVLAPSADSPLLLQLQASCRIAVNRRSGPTADSLQRSN